MNETGYCLGVLLVIAINLAVWGALIAGAAYIVKLVLGL